MRRTVRLPRRLLLGPGTNNDVKLPRLFFDWGTRVDAYSDINTYYTGLWDDIWDNKSEFVELLLHLRPPVFDTDCHDTFAYAIRYGCNQAIAK